MDTPHFLLQTPVDTNGAPWFPKPGQPRSKGLDGGCFPPGHPTGTRELCGGMERPHGPEDQPKWPGLGRPRTRRFVPVMGARSGVTHICCLHLVCCCYLRNCWS